MNSAWKTDWVFTTSSEIHAVKAFSIGADGYLHKPFTHDDFVRAMKRFSRLFEESRRYITVMQGREEVNIYLNTLRFAESVGHSTVLHTSGGEVRVYLPLSSFFGQLEGEPDFLMCGRSYIANLSAVESFDADSGELTFQGGESLIVPVRLRRSVKEQMKSAGRSEG